MLSQIGFWNPIKYIEPPNSPTPLEEKVCELADFYFYLGGPVAVITPPMRVNNPTIVVKIQKEQSPRWKTALKVTSYFTVILPILIFIFKLISRTYFSFPSPPIECQWIMPDNTKIRGFLNNGVLQNGMRIKNQKTSFLCPNTFIEAVPNWEQPLFPYASESSQLEQPQKKENLILSFAEVTINGRQELIPVQKKDSACKEEYVLFSNLPEEALLQIIQKKDPVLLDVNIHNGSAINAILTNKNNFVLSKKNFLDYLLKPKDDGSIPLRTVNPKSLLDILDLAKQININIDISEIYQTKEQKHEDSFFMKAIEGNFPEEANTLLIKITSNGKKLTNHDEWALKAFKDNDNFSSDDFFQLPHPLQQKLLKIANVYKSKQFLQNCDRAQPYSSLGLSVLSRVRQKMQDHHNINLNDSPIRNDVIEIFQPTNPEIEPLVCLYNSYCKDFGELLKQNPTKPWENLAVMNFANELMEIAYVISNLTLDDLRSFTSTLHSSKGMYATYAEALGGQFFYQAKTFYSCTEIYHMIRGETTWGTYSIWESDPKEMFFSINSEAHAKLFYQETTLQNSWRLLYNEYCSRLNSYVPKEELGKVEHRHLYWTKEDTEPKSFNPNPSTRPSIPW